MKDIQNLEQNIADIRQELASARKSEDTEDRLDRIFTDPAGLVWARLAIRLGISPNGVTLASTFFGVIGGALLYFQSLWLNVLGIVLHIFADILDSSDGQVARLTGQYSQFGRILDGISDGLCFVSVYLALGFRLMREPVPFTDGRLWGFWIWPLVLLAGGVCHMEQCRMADYYRNLHLFFLREPGKSELSRSKALKEEAAAAPDVSLWERAYRRFYLDFTRKQERRAPRTQELLDAVERDGGAPSAALREAFLTKSVKYIQLTNLLTYNLRAYTLYVLLLLGLHVYFFPFVILVMGLLNCYMIRSYEQISSDLLRSFFPGEAR